MKDQLHNSARRFSRGFTFIEILFAVILLGVGFIMLAAMFPVAIRQTQTTVEETQAAGIAQDAAKALQQLASGQVPAKAGTATLNVGTTGTAGTFTLTVVYKGVTLSPPAAWNNAASEPLATVCQNLAGVINSNAAVSSVITAAYSGSGGGVTLTAKNAGDPATVGTLTITASASGGGNTMTATPTALAGIDGGLLMPPTGNTGSPGKMLFCREKWSTGTSARVENDWMWKVIRGNLILNRDTRYAWIPFYRRNDGDNFAQVIFVVLQNRNRGVYEAAKNISLGTYVNSATSIYSLGDIVQYNGAFYASKQYNNGGTGTPGGTWDTPVSPIRSDINRYAVSGVQPTINDPTGIVSPVYAPNTTNALATLEPKLIQARFTYTGNNTALDTVQLEACGTGSQPTPAYTAEPTTGTNGMMQAGGVRAAAEGAYVIVSDDPYVDVNDNNIVGKGIGYIFRLGRSLGGDKWELMAGSDMKQSSYRFGIPTTGGTATLPCQVYIIGRGFANPNKPTVDGTGKAIYDGGAQDVGAYSTFIRLN